MDDDTQSITEFIEKAIAWRTQKNLLGVVLKVVENVPAHLDIRPTMHPYSVAARQAGYTLIFHPQPLPDGNVTWYILMARWQMDPAFVRRLVETPEAYFPRES